MATYQELQNRIDRGDVIILDGAVGTGLQNMNVPMHGTAWAAAALQTHPYTVRQLHEVYIKAGVDVLTTNTYSSARHNLEPLGLGDLTTELNIRGVVLAREARDRAARDRPVFIGGAVSNYGLVTAAEPRRRVYGTGPRRTALTPEQTQQNLREQAAILAEAGVDFMLAESTGGMEHRKWVVQACLATGLPTWIGIKCRVEGDDPTPRVGYSSDVRARPRARRARAPRRQGHQRVPLERQGDGRGAADRARAVVGGPSASIRKRAARTTWTRTPTRRARTTSRRRSSSTWPGKWVQEGVQIVGGCCGIGPDYIRPLRGGAAETASRNHGSADRADPIPAWRCVG